MGLENVSYELVTDVRRFHTNGERKVHETSAEDDVRAFVQENPTFKLAELGYAFFEKGRAKSSAAGIVSALVKEGLLVKLGGGNYQRADVKAIEPPKPEKTKRGGALPYEGLNNRALILKAMKGRTKISVQGMAELLVSHGRNGKSASPIISGLAKARLLKLIEPGLYEVVKAKPKPEPKAKPKMAAKPSNDEADRKERDRLRKQAARDRLKAEATTVQPQQEEANG